MKKWQSILLKGLHINPNGCRESVSFLSTNNSLCLSLVFGLISIQFHYASIRKFLRLSFKVSSNIDNINRDGMFGKISKYMCCGYRTRNSWFCSRTIAIFILFITGRVYFQIIVVIHVGGRKVQLKAKDHILHKIFVAPKVVCHRMVT